MLGPYGRNASMYYHHAGTPRSYEYNWHGVPMPGNRASTTRALGDELEINADIQARYVATAGPDDGFIETEQGAMTLTELGDYQSYPTAQSAQSGARSILHSGIEQTHLYDAPRAVGAFGALSDNEKRLGLIALVGIAGYFAWKKYGKPKRRRNGRRKRRR